MRTLAGCLGWAFATPFFARFLIPFLSLSMLNYRKE